jgi:hypothetical protein
MRHYVTSEVERALLNNIRINVIHFPAGPPKSAIIIIIIIIIIIKNVTYIPLSSRNQHDMPQFTKSRFNFTFSNSTSLNRSFHSEQIQGRVEMMEGRFYFEPRKHGAQPLTTDFLTDQLILM